MQENNLPLVSVVITTKNEGENIENCLKSIREQAYPHKKIEIIVVDNNSSDNTKELAKKYTDQVFDKGPERSAQRNFGAQKSQGKYYMYLDADMILSKDVIKECVEKIEQEPETIALYIPELVMGDSFWCKSRRFERSFYDATVIDACRFVRRKDFMAIQGFDETMTGPEDWDFDKKLRSRGHQGLIKAPIHHNEGEFEMKEYLKKKKYYAQNFDRYITKWGENDKDVKKQFGIWYRYFGVFTERGKWKKLVAHPTLTIGMYSLRFLVGVSYLTRKKQSK